MYFVFVINCVSKSYEIFYQSCTRVEFSQNFSLESMENLESVKGITESNFEMFLDIKYSRFFMIRSFCRCFTDIYSLSSS